MSTYIDLTALAKNWKDKNYTLPIIAAIDNNCQFGVEIECFKYDRCRYSGSRMWGCDCNVCSRQISQIETPRSWVKGFDGSVSGNGYEIRSPILRGRNGLIQLKDVLTRLRRNGYGVNTTCGGHTTLSLANGNPSVEKVRDIWQGDLYNIFSRLPGARGLGNYNCRDKFSSYNNKSAALNYQQGFQAFEFRLWAGTLDYRQWAAQVGLGYLVLKAAKEA